MDPDALKAYGATIEEARADLFGLYYLADAKLVELGLTPDAEAYKAQYYGYMMNGLLTQMVRIEPERDIEEAHMRNRALIARWAFGHGREEGVAELVKRDGKTYVASATMRGSASCSAFCSARYSASKAKATTKRHATWWNGTA